MLNETLKFEKEREKRIRSQGRNSSLGKIAREFTNLSHKEKYSYNFSWLGRPIIQYPQDIVAVQELIYKIKPDLIIETGIAHGGSLILSASMLSLLDIMENLNPKESNRRVLGIDIDIRSHNKEEILNHPLNNKIVLIEGSSIEKEVIKKVHEFAKNFKNIMVFLDSNHTHSHVLSELEAYSSLVSINSYCIVFDTLIEYIEEPNYFDNRDWGVGNNPMTAVEKWLTKNNKFEVDEDFDNKLLISVSPKGFLRRKV